MLVAERYRPTAEPGAVLRLRVRRFRSPEVTDCFIVQQGIIAYSQARQKKVSSIIVCSTDTDTDLPLYTEQFNIHLYLSSGPEMQ